MEPENELLEEEIPIKKASFSGSVLIFGGVLGEMLQIWLICFKGVETTNYIVILGKFARVSHEMDRMDGGTKLGE